MNSTLILVICAILLVLLGCWLGYSSKPNKEARKLLAEKEENELRAKARQEEHGREKNRKAILKQEVFEVLSAAVNYPDDLRGIPYGEPIREFIKRSHHIEFRTEEVLQLKQRVSKQSELIRDLQGQLKEINKALQLGQPVE